MNKLIKVIVLGIFFICTLFIASTQPSISQEYALNESAVVYQLDKPAYFLSGEDNIEEVNNNNTKIAQENPQKELSTEYTEVVTYSDISYTNSKVVEETVDDTYPLTEGYTVTIDQKESFYVTDIDYLTEAINKIFEILINDPIAYQTFIETGEFTPVTIDGKYIYDLSIENKFEVEKGYVPGNSTYGSTEEVMFYLLHGDVEKETEAISTTNNVDDVKTNNELSETELKLNNNGLDSTTLLYDGAELVTNTIDPVIDIVVYYETTKKEVIPYNKVTQKSDTLYVGKSKVHQKGKNGEQEVTYKTKMVNGQAAYTEPVDYVILEQPKDQITYKGTKEKPKEEKPKEEKPSSSSSTGSTSSATSSSAEEEDTESESAAESPTGGFIWPVSSHEIMCGWYCYPGHDGLDFTAWYGAPIYASDGGTVSRAGYSGDMGNYVVIDHGNGYHTRYMHMSSPANVGVGDTVSQGEVIGYVGQTGYATAPHLHFEVIYNGSAINPFEVLP